MTTDDSKAALAAALMTLDTYRPLVSGDTIGNQKVAERHATAILAALDVTGYVVARKPQLEGVAWLPIEGDELARLRGHEAELARLRKVLTAISNHPICDEGCWRDMAREAIRLDDIHGTPTFSEPG